MINDSDVKMSDMSMAGGNALETNTMETKEERRKRKNRERSARYREKHEKKSLSGKELDDKREKSRLRTQKWRARKAQKQIQAAASKISIHGGGVQMAVDTTNNVDRNIEIDEDAGMVRGDGLGAAGGVVDMDEGNNNGDTADGLVEINNDAALDDNDDE
eukprot:708404_1